MLIQEDLAAYPVKLKELVGAGEPLNPEVIDQVKRAWGITIRDGYGQTETTAQIGNSPGQAVKPGSMGRPLPGYDCALLDADGELAQEGEICLVLQPRPAGLMAGYVGDDAKTSDALRGGFYHTGDVAARDAEGYITYVGRSDDVFKASDYRISPFELESVLIQHPAVAEAAVVPSPDPVRLAVPKAFLILRAGHIPGPRPRQGHLRLPAREPGALQAHPADRVREPAQDHLRQDPAGRAAAERKTASRGQGSARAGVLRGGFPRAEGLKAAIGRAPPLDGRGKALAFSLIKDKIFFNHERSVHDGPVST